MSSMWVKPRSPHVLGIRRDDRRGPRRLLHPAGVGVGLPQKLAALRLDLELVAVARAEPREEQLPDPGGAEASHGVQAPVPAIPVAHDADALRLRGPDGERHAADAAEIADVGAELLVDPPVAALAGEVQVEVAEGGEEAVGVVDDPLPLLVLEPEAVGEQPGLAGEVRLE
jgi:hypothetical protein